MTEAEQIARDVYNYLGIDNSEKLQEWFTRLHHIMRYGGDLEMAMYQGHAPDVAKVIGFEQSA